MALKWKNKVLLAKVEATYGVDGNPTGAANALLAKNVRLTPMDGADTSRELEHARMGAQATIPTGLNAKLAFVMELSPGARGVAPAWGPLMRACGCAEVVVATTSVTYNPVSDNHDSATIYFNIDGTLFKLLGARGTATFRANAQGIPEVEFEFTGLYTQPAAGALPTATLTAQLNKKPQIASSASTKLMIGNVEPVMRSFSLAMGNQVEGRFLVGSEGILITDHAEQIEMTIEAVPLATLNPFAMAMAQDTPKVVLTHGTGAGNVVTLTAPTAQMQRPSGLEQNQNVVEWPLRLVPLPNAGDDQWSLALT